MKKNSLLNMYIPNKVVLYWILGIALGLSIILSFSLGIESFRIIFGSILVLFLPGYTLTFNFFKQDEIDLLERIALSFALSISVIPLLVFYSNLIGLRITAVNVSLIIMAVIIVSFLFEKYRKTWVSS